MEWTVVGTLILLGLLLLVVEILFVPGTTLVGLLGFILVIVGCSLSFTYFGAKTGWITVGSSAVLSGLALYLSFRSNLWFRFALKSTSKGTATEQVEGKVAIGEEGRTLSSLRPSGKAEFNQGIFEVRTFGKYADPGTTVRVVQVESNQIIVEIKPTE